MAVTGYTDEELFKKYSEDMTNETDRANSFHQQQNQMLDNNLATQQAGLIKAKTNAQQSASIGYDKMNKYLNQSQMASGLATGQAGTNHLKANNAYQQNRAGISANYSAQNAELLQNHAKSQAEIDKTFADTMTNIGDKYYARNYQAEQDKLAQDNWTKMYEQSQAQLDETRRETNIRYGLDPNFQMDITLDDYINHALEDKVITAEEEAQLHNYLNGLEGYLDDNQKRAMLERINYAKATGKSGTANGANGGSSAATELPAYTQNVESISLDKANVFSFDKYQGSGEGGKQDAYTNAVIKAAKEGKIPDGTIIGMNYGSVSLGKGFGYYIYYQGKFYKAPKNLDIKDRTPEMKVYTAAGFKNLVPDADYK